MIAAACGGGETSGTDGGTEGGGETSGTVTILHAFTGENDVAGLEAMIAAFTEAYPDIEVQQEGSNDFESLARTRVGSDTPPDIMLHPQPGLLSAFVDQGVVTSLDFLDTASFEDDLVPGLLDLGTFDDTLYAVPMRLTLKSTVFYNVPYFEENSLEIPETWDDLLALTETIAGNGDLAPWCIGIESGDATGWIATDWVEDIVIRNLGPEQYDAWVTGDLDFASDEVQGTIDEYMAPIWTNDDYIYGGRDQIVREAFGTAVQGVIGGADADCAMSRGQTALESFITENTDAEFGTDYDFFYFPEIDSSIGNPATGGGDLAAMYSDNGAARTFMEWLATPEAGEEWAKLGGYTSPFAPVFDSSLYPSESGRKASDLLTQATAFRFDGSDLMPADVGASSQDGSFWNEITEWVEGKDLGEALSAIDQLYDEVAG